MAETTPPWVRARTNDADFRAEQASLGSLWSFLGFDSDIPGIDDWFRSTLGGRSIFVQRFKEGIRAFENRCAHRQFPLRRADRGSGPVVCGFHGWRYNAEGRAQGIPQCPEMFGKTAREMDARLPEVELAQCGPMIFGRFPGGPAMSLREWLGDGFAILSHLAAQPLRHRLELAPRTHWKPLYDISLDDYHFVTVHPEWGSEYLRPGDVRYFRFGPHSAYFHAGGETALADMVRDCAAGSYAPQGYRVFQFFPNLMVVLVRAENQLFKLPFWFVIVQQILPDAPGLTRTISRYARFPGTQAAGPMHKLLWLLLSPWVTPVFRRYLRRVFMQDGAICEDQQSTAYREDDRPLLSAHEARIGWFEEEYARYVKLPPPSA